MFLILDRQPADFNRRLQWAAERKGFETLFLTSTELTHDSVLAFHITAQQVRLSLRVGNRTVETATIEGVYCGIDAFEPALWERFSPDDAAYAAKETQALWLAILASLPCRVMNPPALDTLAGTLLSWPEIADLARRFGFQIPMLIILESGRVAADLLVASVQARYVDLGENPIRECAPDPAALSALATSPDQILVREEPPGQPFTVALVGGGVWVCAPDAAGSMRPAPAASVPALERARLRRLQRQLNLNLAEYTLRRTEDGAWFFAGCGRPPVCAAAAYGDRFFAKIVDFATARRAA